MWILREYIIIRGMNKNLLYNKKVIFIINKTFKILYNIYNNLLVEKKMLKRKVNLFTFFFLISYFKSFSRSVKCDVEFSEIYETQNHNSYFNLIYYHILEFWENIIYTNGPEYRKIDSNTINLLIQEGLYE